MALRNELSQQIRKVLPVAGKVWVIYILLFSLVIGTGKLIFNISADQFTRDPNQIVNIPFYIGAISNLGIIFWSAPVTICIFSYLALTRHNKSSQLRKFMLNASIITAVLLFDDLYMWHEEMFPKYLNIPELFIYVFYAVYFLYIFITYKAVIFKSTYAILLCALFFLATSVAMDLMVDIKLFAGIIPAFYRHETLFEDFFKSLGILTWLIYFSHTASTRVLDELKTLNA